MPLSVSLDGFRLGLYSREAQGQWLNELNHIFKDLRADRENIFFEHRQIIPKNKKQAVLNSLHKRHPR